MNHGYQEKRKPEGSQSTVVKRSIKKQRMKDFFDVYNAG